MTEPGGSPEQAVEKLALEIAFRDGARLLAELEAEETHLAKHGRESEGAMHFARQTIEAIRADERKRVLGEFRDWLGSDDEYNALGAIWESLRENPQLIPEQDVPLRLLQAMREAEARFASLPSDSETEGASNGS